MFADELVDGAKGAALPLIRHDLGLSYEQVGLLASVPLLVGGLLELPMGVLAGQGRRRRLVILGGGIVFLFTLLAVASARSFAVLLAAFVAFYPASGAFVSLTQAEVMDAWPRRQAQVMARWDLAGAVWAAWPRRAGGHRSDITDNVIREYALPIGLVDVKVAAIDDDWSGLRLVWRVENRQ